MKTQYFSLKYNKTRQVRIQIDESKRIENLRLFLNGSEFSFKGKAGKYVGCGVDAAHSFMAWIKEDIPRSKIKSKIEVTKWPSMIKSFTAPASFGLWNDKNQFFTTPAQLSVGLEKLIRKNLTARSNLENTVIRHNKGDDNSVIQKIRHHLRRAMPVIALAFKGNHWITIVGLNCIYDKNNNIDSNNTTVSYIDLTKGRTYNDIPYKDLKILGWSSYWGRKYASSYVSGTLISLKSDSILYSDSWSKGWNGKIYEINNQQYLFLLKYSNGLVHIHKIKKDGSIGKRVKNYDWSKGWSNLNFYTVKNKTYLFLMKAGGGNGYTNGLVHIHEMNEDGTVGKRIEKHDWTKGWRKIEFFSYKSKTYIILSKDNGLVNIREMKDNGGVGKLVINSKSFLKNSNVPFLFPEIKLICINDTIYIYGINYNGKKTIYSQFKFYEKNSKFKLEKIDTQNWSKGWFDLDIYQESKEKSFFLISKGLKRNGIMHIHEIQNLKNNAKLGKKLDDNYFRNTFTMGFIPTERWTSIQYFKAKNGSLKLFLLDMFKGRVRIINMKKDGSFDKQLIKSTPQKFYEINIETSDIKNAGTSAGVYLEFKGKNFTSGKIKLDTILDDFERGTNFVQNIPVSNYYGEIEEITLEHDNKNDKPGWHVKELSIKEGTTNNKWTFVINKWFAKTTGDKKIKRTFKI